MVQVPKTSTSPAFRVTRASHLVYTVRDLARSREFYTEVLGLVVSDEDRDTLYLRGVEERTHHSLVLKRTDGAARMCPRRPADLRRRRSRKGEVLLRKTRIASGVRRTRPISPARCTPLTSSAPDWNCALRCRGSSGWIRNSGSCAAAARSGSTITRSRPPMSRKRRSFYTEFGFPDHGLHGVSASPIGVFLHTKDSQYDVVFIRRPGPALHHFAYIVNGINDIIRACDVAGTLGLRRQCRVWARAAQSWATRITSTSSTRMAIASS